VQDKIKIKDDAVLNDDIILDLKDLVVEFNTELGVVRAVDGVSFQLKKGRVLGVQCNDRIFHKNAGKSRNF